MFFIWFEYEILCLLRSPVLWLLLVFLGASVEPTELGHRHLSFLYLVFNGIGSDLRRCIGCGSFEHPVNFKFFNLWGTLGSDHFIATDFNPLINCIILSHMTKYGPCLRHSTGCVTFWRIEIRPSNIIRAYGSGWCAAWQVDLMLANRYDMIIAYFAWFEHGADWNPPLQYRSPPHPSSKTRIHHSNRRLHIFGLKSLNQAQNTPQQPRFGLNDMLRQSH